MRWGKAFWVGLLVSTVAVTSVQGEEREFVGITASQTNGGSGILTMHAMCSAEFPASQTCSSQDIVTSGAGPLDPSLGPAWVHPVIVGVVQDRLTDFSGQTENVAGQTLSCKGWAADTVEFWGLVMTASGSFHRADCTLSLSVACCRERPPQTTRRRAPSK